MRPFRSLLGRISRKLILVFLVGVIWFSVSLLASAMLTTTAVSTSEADGILDIINIGDSNTLWALIIPTTFFLVIGTRPRNRR